MLLLDAFDELSPEAVPGVITELEGLSLKYPDLQIVVTSRPDSEIHHSRHFRTFRLAPLREEDHRPFLKKLLIDDKEVKQLLQAIEGSPAHVASLLTTPLMLTLVAVVYRAEQAIPPELPQFFEILFSTLFSRHDRTKAGFIRKRHSTLTERETQILFEAFCFMTRHHSMSTSLSNQDIERAFRDAVKYSGITCDQDDFYKDITKIACLIQKEGLKTNFVHKSIQEFFAASFVRRANDNFAKKYYEAQRTARSKWRQENAFLAQIDPYRYAKHFFIPELKAIEQVYKVDFSQVTPIADERILSLTTESHEIIVTVDEEGSLDSSVSLPQPPHAGPLLRELQNQILWICFEDIDGELGESKAEILSLMTQVSENEYCVSLRSYFEQRNLMPILAGHLNQMFKSLKHRYDRFVGVINLEESKSGLFDGVTAAVTL